MPILWDILSLENQQELASKYKLPVYLFKTEYGTELRLKGLYYDEPKVSIQPNVENLDEISKLIRRPAHYRMEKLAKG